MNAQSATMKNTSEKLSVVGKSLSRLPLTMVGTKKPTPMQNAIDETINQTISTPRGTSFRSDHAVARGGATAIGGNGHSGTAGPFACAAVCVVRPAAAGAGCV